ncbi:MAG TPA: XdhC family protein [Pararobbsia sp.]|nr:XdhC family protein [Pararobbsia sp.]
MDSVDLEVLKSAARWFEQGRRVTLVCVVRTWGSAPRPVGSLLAVRDDGHVHGSVSGGCIEDDLIDRARDGQLFPPGAALLPQVTTYGVSADEAHRFGLPCGGTLELVLEPVTQRSQLRALLDAIDTHRLVVRKLDLASGEASVSPGIHRPELEFNGASLVSTFGSRYRLLLIGAGQLSRYVAQFAQALDYRVIVCDPREEYALEWDIDGVEFTREMPDDVVLNIGVDAHTAIVALTHDPKLDDMALMEALRTPAFYVGAIGSRANQAKRKERLKLFDVSDAQLLRLHGPVGMYIGARTPPEIAVSILSEMTAIKHGIDVRQRRDAAAASTAESGCAV